MTDKSFLDQAREAPEIDEQVTMPYEVRNVLVELADAMARAWDIDNQEGVVSDDADATAAAYDEAMEEAFAVVERLRR